MILIIKKTTDSIKSNPLFLVISNLIIYKVFIDYSSSLRLLTANAIPASNVPNPANIPLVDSSPVFGNTGVGGVVGGVGGVVGGVGGVVGGVGGVVGVVGGVDGGVVGVVGSVGGVVGSVGGVVGGVDGGVVGVGGIVGITLLLNSVSSGN